MSSEFKTNRRQFAQLALAASGLSLVGAAQAKAADNHSEPKWDETVDVVVVGSGFAGLAAAIEAAAAGAKTVVLEKMRTFGGNSIINGGIYPAPGAPAQIKDGIKDSIDLLEEDMIKAGEGLNHVEKVEVVASDALSTYLWCKDYLGVEWNEDRIAMEGGHSVPRCVVTKSGFGSGIVLPEQKKCKELGVEIRTRCFVENIIRADDGTVTGVKIRRNYTFPKTDSGKVQYIRARRGVILCHGGFGADVVFRSQQDPRLSEALDTTNQPGATSELWREASRIGCNMIQTDRIQCLPFSNPKEKGLGIAFAFHVGGAAAFGVWVSTRTGKRFVNEMANRKVRADAILEERQHGARCLSICNESNLERTRKNRPGIMEKCLERGVVDKYDTLDELAKAQGIPLDALKQTIARHNEILSKGVDEDFGRYINPASKPLTEGSWYCSELMPKVHHCMGGILTDPQCRCLDITTDQPIPGLYAAGEATGGVHGAVRLGSCAVLDCLVNGRMAGRNCAKRQI